VNYQLTSGRALGLGGSGTRCRDIWRRGGEPGGGEEDKGRLVDSWGDAPGDLKAAPSTVT